MDALEEPVLTANAEELYGIRRDLVRYLSGLPGSGSIIDLQRMLLGEHARTSRTQADRDLLKQHRSKLRAIGDALAWLLLPAHTIRTLAKHPGRAAAPPVDAEDAAFVMHVVEKLASAGRVPIVSDLTNVLLVGDIVAVEPGGSVEVVECKNTRIPARPPSSGRLARQRQRGEAIARYLRESAMSYAEEAERLADALGIPAAARPSLAAANLVAMDVDLPEPHPEWLDMACARYDDSPRGVGLVEIGPGDYLLIADWQAFTGDESGDVVAALPPMRRGFLSVHQQQLAEPAPCCRSILSYPLDWELRADLLETELVMVRLVDLAIFEERGDDGVGLFLQDDLSLLWTRGEDYQRFSKRFVDEVMTGPVSAAEMRACLLGNLRYVERELAPLVMEPDQVGRSDQVGRGSGTDVRYTTVYPVPDGELVLVWSAADAGLGAVPGATHAEYYPATGRLIVYGEDGDLLDTELPITD
ncbi:MAG: hypothetical protein ACRDPM_04935 [Solirubrobacteraceae bacterium]